jgi:hypothetical protein
VISLYLRLAAYALAIAACVALGWHMGGLGPKRDLATLQAQDWQGKAQAATAALSATQAQLKTLQDTTDRNAGIIRGLTDENIKTAAERDRNAGLYQRLLNRPPSPPAGGGAVLQAPGGPGAGGPGGASGGDAAPGLLADATAECQRNADRLDALSAQVIPQFQVTPSTSGAPP